MLLDESPVATSVAIDMAAIAVSRGDALVDDAVDDALVTRIERIVRCRTGGRIRDLRVDVSGERVVISGIATTYYAKQLATHAALDEIPGRGLTNAIEVQ